MSGLLGIHARGGDTARPRLGAVAPMLLRHSDEQMSTGENGSTAAAVAALPATAAPDRLWSGDGVLVALYGTAHWADGETEHAGGPVGRDGGNPRPACGSRRLSPAEIGSAYLTHGTALLERLHGSFALAIALDRDDRRETLIATDRLGVQPMCFAVDGEALAFGTRADAVAALAGIESIDAQALFDYLYFHMVPAPRTIFAGVQRLLPGSFALWRDGRLDIRTYWKPRFHEQDPAPVTELQAEFKQALRAGVARTADRTAPDDCAAVGCFLSGGTDSSTVSGLLGQLTGKPAPTFSIGFDAQGYDEMEYARIAARHFATAHREYYVTPDDVVRAVEGIARGFDQPFGNASVVPAYYCARLARSHGITRMLAGDGGDELYGGNERYASQYVFSLYQQVPPLLRRGLLEPLLGALPAAGVLRKARGYVRQANLPLPDRLQTYNLVERIGTAQILNRDFLDSIDPAEPLRLLRESYGGAQAQSQINRLLALDLRFTLADSDLPKVNRACEFAGVDVAYPFLDVDVVDFSLRLPPQLKLKRRQLRWFFKEALRDFLPRAVIEKKKHGFGLPFGVWLRSHPGLHELAGDALSALRRRRIVSESLLDELMSSKLDEHARYYGTLVWVFMTLELWLARPAGAARGHVVPDNPTKIVITEPSP